MGVYYIDITISNMTNLVSELKRYADLTGHKAEDVLVPGNRTAALKGVAIGDNGDMYVCMSIYMYVCMSIYICMYV